MKIMQDEVFLPILPIMPFRDYDEAVSLANDSMYGLSGFAFTSDQHQAECLISDLDVSRLLINCDKEEGIRFPVDGFKHSGNGRHQGDYNYLELTRLKYIRQAEFY